MKNLSKLVLTGVIGLSALTGVMATGGKEVSAKTVSKLHASVEGTDKLYYNKMFKVPSYDLSKYLSKGKVKTAERDFNYALQETVQSLSAHYDTRTQAYLPTPLTSKRTVTVKQLNTKGTHVSYEVKGVFSKNKKMKKDTTAINYITVSKKTGNVFYSANNSRLLNVNYDGLNYYRDVWSFEIFNSFKNKDAKNKKLGLDEYIMKSRDNGLAYAYVSPPLYVNSKGNVVMSIPYYSGGFKKSNIKQFGNYDTGIKASN